MIYHYKTGLGAIALLLASLWGTVAYSQDYNYYYGNIHSHTSFSDGSKDGDSSHINTPAQAYAFARKSEHFDFLGISEHNHSEAGMSRPNYAKGLRQAKTANKDGSFVCLYGMEFGTYANGHVVIYGVDKLINWEEGNTDIHCDKNDYNQVWGILEGYPGSFATLAHPDDSKNYSNLVGSPYSRAAAAVVCGVSVRNGPHTSKSLSYDDPPKTSYYAYYKKMLAAGYCVGPTIDHDNHNTTFGRTTQGRTVVLASALTRKDIMDAYTARRFYASEDWNTKVHFTINGHPMGETIHASQAIMDVTVTDPDTADVIKNIVVMFGRAGTGTLPKSYLRETSHDFRYAIEIAPDEDAYFFLDITQADGNKIYTAPIWVKGSNVK